ncbi:MAG: beta-propeller domain-containing protein [Dethiosulfatibacter sp.]|nr:beta-propeller domain-containing protein [Dethiosulfatibacter sp.]
MKKLLILTLIVLIIGLQPIPAFSEEILPNDSIALHIGSPLVLVGDTMKSLDSDNPDVVPVIHKDRTLVPLRAISEHFGAEVSYNETAREASISFNGRTFVFPIDKNYYTIMESGMIEKTVTFDTESLIIQDRTMVPLRIICEDVLEKVVGYDSKVITVSAQAIVLETVMVDEIKTKIGQAIKISSMMELNKIMSGMTLYATERDSKNESLAPTAGDDYSSTNEQVAGVNEADIIKTDGKYIYVALGKSIKIYLANNGNPILTDEIEMSVDPDTGQYIQLTEMYTEGDRLVILGARNTFYDWIRPIPEPMESTERSIMPYRENMSYTYCGVYSIDENGKSHLIKELEIEGSLLSSRKIDNVVYLVTNKYLYYNANSDNFIPTFRDSTQNNEYKQIPIDKIMYYPNRLSSNYLIVSAIDISDDKEPASINAFLGSGNLVYMSNDALYVAGNDIYTIWGTITNVSKFNVVGTKIGFAGGGMVDGSILNQFSMDEFEGNLRVATTNWLQDSKNAVYILDGSLNQIGSIENIAPTERIYSTRFMGDKGYIVTFRQIDPLFVLDLSDPTSPEITGELKVPGFSNYLHPISQNVLLGIGQNVDEKTGTQLGIKLSLFDVSDQGKPREISNLVLGSSGSFAEVLNNHKALMLHPDRNMIAFDASLSNISGDYQKSYFYGAMIIEAREDGTLKVLQQISNEGLYGSHVKRVIYIGDILYYVLDDNIRAFNIDTFKEIR